MPLRHRLTHPRGAFSRRQDEKTAFGGFDRAARAGVLTPEPPADTRVLPRLGDLPDGVWQIRSEAQGLPSRRTRLRMPEFSEENVLHSSGISVND